MWMRCPIYNVCMLYYAVLLFECHGTFILKSSWHHISEYLFIYLFIIFIVSSPPFLFLSTIYLLCLVCHFLTSSYIYNWQLVPSPLSFWGLHLISFHFLFSGCSFAMAFCLFLVHSFNIISTVSLPISVGSLSILLDSFCQKCKKVSFCFQQIKGNL